MSNPRPARIYASSAIKTKNSNRAKPSLAKIGRYLNQQTEEKESPIDQRITLPEVEHSTADDEFDTGTVLLADSGGLTEWRDFSLSREFSRSVSIEHLPKLSLSIHHPESLGEIGSAPFRSILPVVDVSDSDTMKPEVFVPVEPPKATDPLPPPPPAIRVLEPAPVDPRSGIGGPNLSGVLDPRRPNLGDSLGIESLPGEPPKIATPLPPTPSGHHRVVDSSTMRQRQFEVAGAGPEPHRRRDSIAIEHSRVPEAFAALLNNRRSIETPQQAGEIRKPLRELSKNKIWTGASLPLGREKPGISFKVDSVTEDHIASQIDTAKDTPEHERAKTLKSVSNAAILPVIDMSDSHSLAEEENRLLGRQILNFALSKLTQPQTPGEARNADSRAVLQPVKASTSQISIRQRSETVGRIGSADHHVETLPERAEHHGAKPIPGVVGELNIVHPDSTETPHFSVLPNNMRDGGSLRQEDKHKSFAEPSTEIGKKVFDSSLYKKGTEAQYVVDEFQKLLGRHAQNGAISSNSERGFNSQGTFISEYRALKAGAEEAKTAFEMRKAHMDGRVITTHVPISDDELRIETGDALGTNQIKTWAARVLPGNRSNFVSTAGRYLSVAQDQHDVSDETKATVPTLKTAEHLKINVESADTDVPNLKYAGDSKLHITYLHLGNRIYILQRNLKSSDARSRQSGISSDICASGLFVTGGSSAAIFALRRRRRQRTQSKGLLIDDNDSSNSETEEAGDENQKVLDDETTLSRLTSRFSYVVQPTDTLNSIALELWQDADLAWLILKVNNLRCEWVGSHCTTYLQARQLLELPLPAEVISFYRTGGNNEHKDHRLTTMISSNQVEASDLAAPPYIQLPIPHFSSTFG